MSSPVGKTGLSGGKGLAEQPVSGGDLKIELSERSGTLVVPPLSRYARSRPAQKRGEEPTPSVRPVVRAEPPRAATAGARSDRARSSGDMLPIPTTPEPGPPGRGRLPFWKRIALHRPAPAPAAPAVSLDPVLTRLNELDRRIAENQRATLSRMNSFEENITRLWELEEQTSLNEVRERLALLEANQEEIADALHSLTRNLSLISLLIVLALAGGALAAGILL